ncbi:uncharacterized protein BDW70DRAFT_143806 [Aspergillus foveolatus]|uniref:uncharacterized protein n=1 Tax=Aspergillus foveolatus TaxID=210207 RepID=UPI003CCE3D98
MMIELVPGATEKTIIRSPTVFQTFNNDPISRPLMMCLTEQGHRLDWLKHGFKRVFWAS